VHEDDVENEENAGDVKINDDEEYDAESVEKVVMISYKKAIEILLL
jgi:hypothetical protein